MSQLLPGSKIGIIGGQEQIISIAIAAKQYGYIVHSYHEEHETRIFPADVEIIGDYADRVSLFEFASKVDTVLVMTNLLDVDVLFPLSGMTRYYQSFELAEIAQNCVVEKLYLEEHAINVAPYGVVTSIGELPDTLSSIGFPAILERNRMTQRSHERVMLYDHDMDEEVLQMIEEESCMVTAFVPAQRQFSVTVLRDYEDNVTILPITEDIYVDGILKYAIASKRMNPEWVGELRTIAAKVIRSLSGATIVSIQVMMSEQGIFYVKKVDQLPLIQHHFSRRQIPQSLAEIMTRLATGLPVLHCEASQESVIVPIYESILNRARMLTVLKPEWEFEYFTQKVTQEGDVLGVIRLTGQSSVDLINELELSGLHDGFSSTSKSK